MKRRKLLLLMMQVEKAAVKAVTASVVMEKVLETMKMKRKLLDHQKTDRLV